MLTSETKRHIDAARQVLVGKIPDPKSQVHEITNALIYKFMDDMDERAVSMGGKRRYFAGEFEKYSWRTIMNPKVGSHERIDLYMEALSRLSKNPNLPELFRGIFRNAYLPFNDGRTLSMFLSEIDYFDYKKSGELGDAYEYLLSIMGSQGDAGQFRTPRHIIDFIVKVINPTKDDSVLDPACGTAGFLISAYKHVMSKYDGVDDETGKPKPEEKPLSADEKQKLHKNYRGFDIDDNMVKMAQVNLYLHGFPDPNIIVHDTLSSEDFWQDRYDVIFANPPFMSPKGGIVPHNKFGIQSTRSEVLFVDYIVSHLKPNGRAGIIVPEGIIFQSGKAHKQLRENLVKDGLYCVVSLPSGVFNPYAGVKTSILLFNNEPARTNKEILFIKIENDGFDLGATKRPISKNDLPTAIDILNKWRTGEKVESKLAAYVEKTKIAENSDYNLSGDRYRVATDYTNAKWPMVKLGEIVLDMKDGGTPSRSKPQYFGGDINWAVVKDIESEIYDTKEKLTEAGLKNSSAKVWPVDSVIISLGATIGNVGIAKVPIATKQGLSGIVVDKQRILPKFLYYILVAQKEFIQSQATGASIKEVRPSRLKEILIIPLPPPEIQEQIVAELDGYQKIIDAARQIVSSWKPKINIDSKWEKVKLGEVCGVFGGGTPSRSEEKYWGGDIPWLSARYFSDDHRVNGSEMITGQGLKNSSSKIAPKGSTILITRVSVGKFAIADQDYAINQDLTALVANSKNLNPQYLWLISEIVAERIKVSAVGVGVTGVTRDFVVNQEIPLPPLAIQKQIVEKIEAERAIVNSNKKLIEIYQQKVKDTIAKLWG